MRNHSPKVGRPKRDRDPELRHPGVEILKPYPKHGRPHWRLRWRDAAGQWAYRTLAHLVLTDARSAKLEAARESARLLKGRAVRASGITLHTALRLYLADGKRKARATARGRGVERSDTHAPTTTEQITASVDALCAFALANGAAPIELDGEPKSVMVDDMLRVIDHRSLLAHWVAHEKRRPARGRGGRPRSPGSVGLTTKWAHAVLRHLRRADGTSVFDPTFLQAVVPVRATSVRHPPRLLEPHELAVLLDGAMQLDNATELPSAAIALLLVATLRRFEACYLRCKHVALDVPVRLNAQRKAVAIKLPAWLDEQRSKAHAKNAEARTISFAYREPGEDRYRGLSPLGAELVVALAHKRKPNTWLMGGDYERVETYLRNAAKRAGIGHVTLQSLRMTSANHVREMIGDERAAQRNGHTEQVMHANYIDAAHELDMTERPPTLEVSLGIEAQLAAIVARVKLHARAWSEPRPLPRVAGGVKRPAPDTAVQATQ